MAAGLSAALLAAAAALLPGLAAAQDFTGIWELVTPVPGPTGLTGPSGTYFGLPATTAGMFVVASSDAAGANSTFAFDPTPMQWSEFPPPSGYTALQPVVIAFGGFLVSFSTGLTDDLTTISVIDSSAGALATWTTIQLPPSTPNYPFRNGGRVALFGSILYRYGGCDMAGCHNDICAWAWGWPQPRRRRRRDAVLPRRCRRGAAAAAPPRRLALRCLCAFTALLLRRRCATSALPLRCRESNVAHHPPRPPPCAHPPPGPFRAQGPSTSRRCWPRAFPVTPRRRSAGCLCCRTRPRPTTRRSAATACSPSRAT